MQTTYVQPGILLDYRNGGLDRFGRIANHAWRDASGDALVQISHGYDLAGNRTNRQDGVNAEWSEAYGYDEMGQITSLQRSDLTESWQYDPTGNWMQYNRNNIVETRTHNAVNEILNTIVHDANGNMTTMPSPKTGTTLNCVYDAWNRQVAIGENIHYEYNGLNHRIAKTVDAVRTESFFNEQWQELESKRHEPGTVSPVLAEYVWGQRYIDDLIYREKGDEKLYSVADPNWNVVATVDEDGVVQERFQYDAFGKVGGLTSDWNRTFTGQVLDDETGLMLYRMRFYHAGLGRFVGRDPIGYRGNDYSLFRYAYNSPRRYRDSYGLDSGYDNCIKRMEYGCFKAYGPEMPQEYYDCIQKGKRDCCREHGKADCDTPAIPPIPPAPLPPSPKPGPPTAPELPREENFYVCTRRVEPGEKCQQIAHECNAQHSDIYGDISGEVYHGALGPIKPDGSGLPSGKTCKKLKRITTMIIPDPDGFASTRIDMTISWGPAKGKLCINATSNDILNCLQSKPKPINTGTVYNCQVDCYLAAAGCCLNGYTSLPPVPVILN